MSLSSRSRTPTASGADSHSTSGLPSQSPTESVSREEQAESARRASAVSASQTSSSDSSTDIRSGGEAAGRSIAETVADVAVEVDSRPQFAAMDELCSLKVAELERMHERFNIPRSYGLVLPLVDQRACYDLENGFCLYVDQLQAGLRLPIHPFFKSILRYYGLHPAQLTPNGWRSLVGFFVLCSGLSLTPTLALFRKCFVIKSHTEMGWYYFGCRPKVCLFTGKVSSIHGWKNKFFYLESSNQWELSQTWTEFIKLTRLNVQPALSHAETDAFEALVKNEPVRVLGLLKEEVLVGCGLSSGAAGTTPPPHTPYLAFLITSSY